jgi:hypothetical protein
MRFSVLHVSDLHRDLKDEVANGPLLDSILRDVEHYENQNPQILRPALCVVSGDLIYGVRPDLSNPDAELARQYDQAVEFLVLPPGQARRPNLIAAGAAARPGMKRIYAAIQDKQAWNRR